MYTIREKNRIKSREIVNTKFRLFEKIISKLLQTFLYIAHQRCGNKKKANLKYTFFSFNI